MSAGPSRVQGFFSKYRARALRFQPADAYMRVHMATQNQPDTVQDGQVDYFSQLQGQAMPHLLILDKDKEYGELLAELAQDCGFSVAYAESTRKAWMQFDMRQPDLLLADVQTPEEESMDVCREALSKGSEVVIMTARKDVGNAVEALRLGVNDYFHKPVCLDRLRQVLEQITADRPLCTRPHSETDDEHGFRDMVGTSAPMRAVYRQIQRVAPSTMTVFIVGESGTGKELVAHAIHDCSPRRDKLFLAVNCGAIPETLIESEMFGHERGSFTGADKQYKGYFERADGGTLFLDEITEMSLDLQVKLLRVLETGCFMRIGGNQELSSDVRVIAATNRSPEKAVKMGKLREDLYYRLAVFPLGLPALRTRGGDIVLLVRKFLAELNTEAGTQHYFSDEALKRLCQYHWPGNVRELRNTVHRAYVLADDGKLKASFLPIPRTRNKKVPGTMATYLTDEPVR